MTLETVPQESEPSNIKRNRRMGILIMAVVAAPMLAALWIFKTGYGIPASTVNKGVLLVPASSVNALTFTEENLDDETEQAWTLSEQKKKWRILIPGESHCNEACQQTLYLTRQVHVGLAQKSYRVERVYVSFNKPIEPEVKEFLKEQHPGIKLIYTQGPDWQQWLQSTNAPKDPFVEHNYFLVDQEGFAMMFYGQKHTGKQLMTDLKRLLKYSYE